MKRGSRFTEATGMSLDVDGDRCQRSDEIIIPTLRSLLCRTFVLELRTNSFDRANIPRRGEN